MTAGFSRRSALSLGLFSIGGQLLGAAKAAPNAPIPDNRPHRFTLHPDGFQLDGTPLQIRAGEMHPARIPRSEWAARIAMAKAMGLNTISIYLMWNTLESAPGIFDLHTDRRDFKAFFQLCHQAGMWVFLRPGPYICGEWDFGGLPAYLLFDDDIALRTLDPRFLLACERYISTIGKEVAPYLAENGGPILMTQIENEYASFGGDKAYMAWIRDTWIKAGIPGPFSTADGLQQLTEKRTFLPGCAIGLDGENSISGAKSLDANDPAWVSEAYPGWLTHWEEQSFAKVDFERDFRAILASGLSFNLYVVHGGTNFGFGAGANGHRDGSNFQPVVTSYDYDAPIDEAGRPTEKYESFRQMIAEKTGTRPIAIPASPPVSGFAAVMTERGGSLWDILARPLKTIEPVSFERGWQQNQGMAVYRTTIPSGVGGILHLPRIHDYARIFLDNADIGTLSRSDASAAPIAINASEQPRQLDILLDTFGHIGYGPALGDRKGMEGPVTLGATPLKNWYIFGLPLDATQVALLGDLPISHTPQGFLFRAQFDQAPKASTYLDMRAWQKGYVWVNGQPLGRFWHKGPQRRLYCPAEWLRPNGNKVLILDYHQKTPAPISGETTLIG